MVEEVRTDRAPAPVGPYSQAIAVGNVEKIIFVSGQIPLDPTTGELVKGDFKDQVARVLENVKALLEASGATLRDVVKVTVYLKDASYYGPFNEVYSRYFEKPYPARAVVVVSDLPRGAPVEVEVVAVITSSGRGAGRSSGAAAERSRTEG